MRKPATRKHWAGAPSSVLVVVLLVVFTSCRGTPKQSASRPNVILVMTDDQGYGDVAVHGNPVIKTPNLDRLRSESVRLTDFHVDPTCSPTRSALLTGRYSTRTGVWHTIMGRSLMRPEEVTLAEVFRDAGYRTGIFGKWHLGDNYPLRPQDQGFEEVFVHGGGGVGQTPDYFGNDYFDDTYFRNGVPEQVEGYCTDVWFNETLRFIESNKEQPFLLYLPTNAPHGPFLVAPEYSEPYRQAGLSEILANFYGMITNFDDNMGRLLEGLENLGLADNTILIFMTDNGSQVGAADEEFERYFGAIEEGAFRGFNAGMRGRKGSEYDGGHRVPFFIRWPAGGLEGGRDVPQLTAHIDVPPTLMGLAGIEQTEGPPLDGASLAPLLRRDSESWPERTLFVHSQRIEYPEKWRKSAVMTERHRLVNGEELYDIEADPGQANDLASERPELVAELRRGYEAWWQSLASGFDEYVRIGVGSEAENPAHLTAHDWHAPQEQVPGDQGHIRNGLLGNGYWEVEVTQPGKYRVKLRRWPPEAEGPLEAKHARVKIGDPSKEQDVSAGATSASFEMDLPAGPARLQTWLTKPDGSERGAYYVEVTRLP